MFFGTRNDFALALKDFREGIAGIYVWPTLGWLEIKQRYRRSILGPFWLTLSTGALVGGMGPLYGKLLGIEIGSYFPFLVISFVVWIFLAGIINDACLAFIAAEGFIKQMKLPLTTHIMRMVWKNLIVFQHNVVIIVLVLLYWPPPVTWHMLLILAGVLAIAVNGIWIGVVLGLLCARFRDIPQIIANLVQVAFFLTPVIWKPHMLGRHQWAAELNPFYHFIELVRAPLVSGTTNWSSWGAVLLITAAGYAVTFVVFARFRARIAYWV